MSGRAPCSPCFSPRVPSAGCACARSTSTAAASRAVARDERRSLTCAGGTDGWHGGWISRLDVAPATARRRRGRGGGPARGGRASRQRVDAASPTARRIAALGSRRIRRPTGTAPGALWRMGAALAASGLASPDGSWSPARGRAGVLVTVTPADGAAQAAVTGAGGIGQARAPPAPWPRRARASTPRASCTATSCRRTCSVRDGEFVLLDHDRTRRGRALVWWGARRNLVQLGRFVVPACRRRPTACACSARTPIGAASASCAPPPRAMGRREDDRRGAIAIDRIAEPDAGAPGIASAHAERRSVRSGGARTPRTRDEAASSSRSRIRSTRGMLRALARHRRRGAARTAGSSATRCRRGTTWSRRAGIPREHVAIVPGLGRWRRLDRAAPACRSTLARLCRARCAAPTRSTRRRCPRFPHCWYAGRMLVIPQVVHVYSSYGEARPYRKHLLARARHVIAPSGRLARARRAARSAACGSGVRARVALQRHGRRADRSARRPRCCLSTAPTRGPRIGMVGNLDWRKNPRCLVEADAGHPRRGAGVAHRASSARFPMRPERPESRAHRRARDRRHAESLTGFLPNPFPLVRALDVARASGAARSVLRWRSSKSMALARPIVASAVGGIPEMLIDGESGVARAARRPARAGRAR